MKSFTTKLITAAATLIAATVTASAQSNLIGNVPFSFQVNSHTVLPAGEYYVNHASTTPNLWAFEDRQTGKKTMVAIGQNSGSRSADAAKLEFLCRGEHCALIKIQAGYGESGYEIPAPKMIEKGQARIVAAPLTRNAE